MMFRRYRLSWRLVRSCFRLLRTHSDLLLFPIVTVILITLLIAIITVGILLWVHFDLSIFSRLTAWQQTLLTFVYYVVSYCLGIYANTALVSVVLQLLAHQPIDMRAGWRVANERLLSILGYALIMATVGMVLRLIFKPIGSLGSVVAPVLTRMAAFTFVGLAWNLVPYFVVPVLIAENPGSFPVIQRSSALVRQKWGEDVVVNASVWLVFALPLLVVLLLGTPAMGWALINLDEWRLVWIVYAVTMLVLLTFLLKMAMDAIFAAVVYRYATTGETHDFFHDEDLQLAFVTRPSQTVNAIRSWFGHRSGLFRHQPTTASAADASTSAKSLPVAAGPDAMSQAQPTPPQEYTPDLPGSAVHCSQEDATEFNAK
jgi:hypothetical protein